mmetsp:Transcript_8175/g.9062  ORF Transcript_8175/g.9062 Transcript_8175/m.9062 type:complete len:99 (+) Transcript_8175:44-340(+)
MKEGEESCEGLTYWKKVTVDGGGVVDLSSPSMIHGGVALMTSVVLVLVAVVVPNAIRLRIVLERVLELVLGYDPVGVLVDSMDLEDVDVDNDDTLVLE